MKAFTVLAGSLCALVLLGLITRQGGFIALAIPLVVYLAVAVATQPKAVALQITRQIIPKRVIEEQAVVVNVEIANEGSRLEEVFLQDHLPGGIQLKDRQAEWILSLLSEEKAPLSYSFSAPRGSYQFDCFQAISCDPFGLIQHTMSLPAPDDLTVLPKPVRMHRMVLRPFQTRMYPGPIPSRTGGAGVTFLSLRGYRSGDPLRWVNWRSSARKPSELIINEFEQERITDVCILLDARQRVYRLYDDESLYECAVQAASALADLFLRDGHRVSLLIFGWHRRWVYPGYGRIQSERIRQCLASSSPGGGIRLETLPTQVFPPRSQIILISPVEEADVDTIIGLRAHGYEVFVISPNLISYAIRKVNEKPGHAVAYRIAHLERNLLFNQIRKAGIVVVDWCVDQPLNRVINQATSWKMTGGQAIHKVPLAIR